MELRQLAAAVAVAEEGGFTAAAQRLRTVQSTVSTVVRALERDLGTQLFLRTTHRVVLTPAGEAFVPAARAALQAADRARAVVSPVSGKVRLGVGAGVLADLPRVLAGLRQAHPGVTVEVRQLRRGWPESDVDVALTAADAGLALGSAPGEPGHPDPGCPAVGGAETLGRRATPDPPDHPYRGLPKINETGAVVTLLPPEDLVLATAPGGARSAPADLSALPLVGFPPGWAIRQAVDRAFPGRRTAPEVDDLAVAAGIVAAGLASCVLPASAAARFPGLGVRRFDCPPPWQLAAVHCGEPSPAVAALLAQLG